MIGLIFAIILHWLNLHGVCMQVGAVMNPLAACHSYRGQSVLHPACSPAEAAPAISCPAGPLGLLHCQLATLGCLTVCRVSSRPSR
jgi:hypothetical protein